MSDFEDQQRRKRLEDLENKRKRLEEMRKMKKDRVQAPSSTPPTVAAPASVNTDVINVDDLVNSLLSPSSSNAVIGNLSSLVPESVPVVAPASLNSMNLDDIRRMRAQELVTIPNVVQINIFPCISETYEKGTQADLEDFIDEKIVNATQTPHRRTRSESMPPPPSELKSNLSTLLSPLTSSYRYTIEPNQTTRAILHRC
jgi:hypothetical protein